jgi:hypothetical protein
MWRRVDVLWTDVWEERIASVFMVEKSASEEPAWACGCRLSHQSKTQIRERGTSVNRWLQTEPPIRNKNPWARNQREQVAADWAANLKHKSASEEPAWAGGCRLSRQSKTQIRERGTRVSRWLQTEPPIENINPRARNQREQVAADWATNRKHKSANEEPAWAGGCRLSHESKTQIRERGTSVSRWLQTEPPVGNINPWARNQREHVAADWATNRKRKSANEKPAWAGDCRLSHQSKTQIRERGTSVNRWLQTEPPIENVNPRARNQREQVVADWAN